MNVFPVVDGVLVVPAALPFHVPTSVYGMTVAEWLNLDRVPEEVSGARTV
ncbi:hypothetical protein [Streptosporangium saharense]|uniref:Uncharacterized protein n=1 Tax=Streptosporangium saharense TaxID=1706840 RepID=A0A7W7VMC4_9ACTN|nr:hypothetical protein [Streptosporangium saharense]MBB4915105.1 hypothetical protein [Streptosporangium saharense]